MLDGQQTPPGRQRWACPGSHAAGATTEVSWVRGASKRLSLYFDHISPAADGREAELETAAVAEFKGWSLQTMANAFLGFAGARLLLSLATGLVIDRFGALKLASLYPLPLAAGLLALLFMEHQSAAGIYLFLAGCSQGMASPILTALWAELYGVDNLGAIKGMVSSFGVFSTALGPLLLAGSWRVECPSGSWPLGR